jgi:diguanylate cyclase (GGDEF)-like protein
MMEEGAAPGGATEILAGLRVVLLRRLWLAAVVVALIGGPASLLRAFATGWQPAYVLHLMVAGTILGVQLAGDRLPPVVKRVIIIANPLVLGAIGLFGFAMLGNGISTLLFACVITSLLYPVRGTLLVAIVSAALVVSAGMLYVSGGLKLGFDANLFVRDPRAWINVVFALLLSTAIVLIAMAHYQNSILILVREVDRQREVILHQALHDQLTGLPHRQLAADRLEMAVLAARRKPAPDALAVLYIDLDGFKSVNDRFGHAAGDAVLAATAERLRRAVRATDSVARLGGDEFLIILQDFGDRARLAALSAGIAQALASPVAHDGRELAVAASIGIALFPEHGADAPSLRHAADTAMYAAKQRGPGNTAFAGDLIAAE